MKTIANGPPTSMLLYSGQIKQLKLCLTVFVGVNIRKHLQLCFKFGSVK